MVTRRFVGALAPYSSLVAVLALSVAASAQSPKPALPAQSPPASSEPAPVTPVEVAPVEAATTSAEQDPQQSDLQDATPIYGKVLADGARLRCPRLRLGDALLHDSFPGAPRTGQSAL